MPDHLIEKLLHSRKMKDAVKILGMLSVSHFQFAIGSARSIQEASEIDTTELFHFMMNQTLGMDHPGVSVQRKHVCRNTLQLKGSTSI